MHRQAAQSGLGGLLFGSLRAPEVERKKQGWGYGEKLGGQGWTEFNKNTLNACIKFSN